MNFRILAVYREDEFSPGKVDADRAIMDAVLANLRDAGARTDALDASSFVSASLPEAELVLAMCQGGQALKRLASLEEAGAIVINSPLAIRNCYRDLLGLGLIKARVPVPEGAVVRTEAPIDLKPLRNLDLSAPLYVKRGDLHALAPSDIRRVEGMEQLKATLTGFATRQVPYAYVQQEAVGCVVKFYGVGTGREYFSAIAEDGYELEETVRRELVSASGAAAGALGLEVWGGDAVVEKDRFSIIDFNDWPSFERVREGASQAIARQCVVRLRHQFVSGGLAH
jgi:hypothetical protein